MAWARRQETEVATPTQGAAIAEASDSQGVAKKYRVHLIALFFSVITLFILLLLWQLRSDTGEVYSLIDSLASKSQPTITPTQSKNDSTTNAVKLENISSQLSQPQANPPALVVTQYITNIQQDGLYVRPQDQPASGDITGTFNSGLSVGSDAVELGADTVGNYVATLTTGLGIDSSGSGEGSAVSLAIKPGDGIIVDTNGVGVTVQFGGGLRVDSTGLALIDTCSDGQMLKWVAVTSTWVCAADNAGGGSLTVRESDGSPSVTPTALLEFGPSSSSTDEFVVTDQGGGSTRIRTGTAVPLTNASQTITGNWTFNTALVANGGLALGGNTYTNIAGTGLSFSSGTLSTTLGNSIDSSEVTDGTITAADIADGTITFAKLGQNSCTTGQTVKWNGSAWVCAADIDTDTDTNTTYSAGAGLSLSGTTFSLDVANPNTWSGLQTFSGGLSLGGNSYTNLVGNGLSFASGTVSSVLGTAIDSSEIVDGTIAAADIADNTLTLNKLGQNGCSTNQIIKWNGTAWACAADVDTDTNTTYSAGSGLGLSGTTFSLDVTNPNTWVGLQTFNSGLALGGGSFTNLVGTGLSLSSGTLSTTLGTSVDSSEIADGTITAADIANGTITFAKLGQNSCSINQVIKWDGSVWACAADIDTDTNTTYSAGTGLLLSGTTFLLDMTNPNTWSGLQTFSSGMALGGNTYTNLAGTGLSFSSGTLATILGTSIDNSEIVDGTITAADIADGTLTLSKLGQNSCTTNQIIKWNGSAWACAADIDTDTTYSAGSGLSQASTVFSLNLASGSGLAIASGALTLLNTCSNGQYLAWTTGSSSWGCASLAAAPNIFQTVSGDSGSAVADASNDTITLVGGNGLSSTGSDVSDTVTFNIDLASGSGLAFSGGALTLQSCSDGQVLKRVSSAWACAASLPAAAYKQQLAGTDNVSVASSLTPLLTNGSGTAQSLGVTMGSGNAVSFNATIQISSTLATGPATFVVIRDDNHDNDCATGGGDGTQIGGQVTSFLATIAQSFTTTLNFTDTAPAAGTNYYQLCASTSIAVGTTAVTNRALKLEETSV